MSSLDKKYVIHLDIINDIRNEKMKFRLSDNKTNDFYIKITKSMEPVDLTDKIVTLYVVKPNKNVVYTKIILYTELNSTNVFYCNLLDNFKNIKGNYYGQIVIEDTITKEKVVVPSKFSYIVESDTILQTSEVVDTEENKNILDTIISYLMILKESYKSDCNINDNDASAVTTYSGNKIETIKSELGSQITENTSRIEALANTPSVIDDKNTSINKVYSSSKTTQITNRLSTQIQENTSRIEALENTENSTSIDVIDDENISADKAYSSNKTTEITNGLSARINDNKRRLDELQLTGGTDEIVFDTFPSDDILNSLPMETVFEVKGFYTVGDMPKCAYQKACYAENCIEKSTYYIKPITDNDSTLFLPQIGIRAGKEHAVQNSNIMAQTNFRFASALKLPTGDYYFDRPIDLMAKQLSLIGECVSFTPDYNAKGITILTFENLAEGEKAITVGTGTLSNITVRGNKNHYDYYIDRTQTYTNKNNIEQETCVRRCYGIYGGSITTIFNVHVEHFYYGCYLNTSNVYIDNIFARRCHIGLSIGGDTKCKGIYGWDVHTLLRMNRSISSAVQVRADSCHHLVHIVDYLSGIQLTDLDADYCLGSVVKFGNYNEWSLVKDIVINGITGRACCLNAYDSAKDPEPTSANITNVADVSNWGFISVENQTILDGAVITMAHNLSSNPLDRDSTLRTPSILLAAAGVAYAMFNTTFKNDYGELGNININRQTLLDSMATLSNNSNSARICLNTPSGTYYLHKPNPNLIITKKQATEILE